MRYVELFLFGQLRVEARLSQSCAFRSPAETEPREGDRLDFGASGVWINVVYDVSPSCVHFEHLISSIGIHYSFLSQPSWKTFLRRP